MYINATIDRESLIQGSFRLPRMKREKGDGLLPSEEINGSPAGILKSVVPISKMVSHHIIYYSVDVSVFL